MLGLGAVAYAAPVQFTIQPSLNSLELIGSLGGNTLFDQTPDSRRAAVEGAINADVTFNSFGQRRIQITSSVIDLMAQPFPQQPGLAGVAGTAAADYGAMTRPGQSGTGFLAVRDVRFNYRTVGTAPFPDNNTISFGSELAATNVDLDFATTMGTGSSGRRELDGQTSSKSECASIQTAGAFQTLTLQLSHVFRTGFFSTDDSTFIFDGTIVATRVVPEPATLALLGGALMAAVRRRRA